jgi:hypothetical protein
MEIKMKIRKNYRINKLIVDELEKITKLINVSETSFIEISLIEKMSKLKSYSNEKKEIDKIYDFIDKVSRNG